MNNKRRIALVSVLCLLVTFLTASFTYYRLKVANLPSIDTYSTAGKALSALKQNPYDATAHRTLAEDAFNRRDYNTSVQEWEQVVQIDPTNEDAALSEANALSFAGQSEAAVNVLTRLSQKDDVYGATAKKMINTIRRRQLLHK